MLTTHGQTYTVGYERNELGQTTQLQYPDGSLIDRAYTDRGQLLTVKYTPNGGTQADVADFVYDAGRRETTRNLGNGLTTTRSYFADNQIQSIATPGAETLTYSYDANKNPTSEIRSGVMAPYSWSTGPSGFDDEDRLVNWSRTNGDSQTWNLTAVHDWTTTTINGAVQNRTHGPAHEILTMSGAEVPGGSSTLQHDAKGNMTTDERGCGMQWDFDNMLEAFTANGVTDLEDATYTYDAIGRRVSKSVTKAGGIETTLFVHSADQVVCIYQSDAEGATTKRVFVYGAYVDEPILFAASTANPESISYFHRNRQFSTYALTNSSGGQQEFYLYDLLGLHQVLSPTASSLGRATHGNHRITYTGRLFDAESGHLNFRARAVSAKCGRFISRDFVHYYDGLSLYAKYFSVDGMDPSGLTAISSKEKETQPCLVRILIGHNYEISDWLKDDYGSDLECTTDTIYPICCGTRTEKGKEIPYCKRLAQEYPFNSGDILPPMSTAVSNLNGMLFQEYCEGIKNAFNRASKWAKKRRPRKRTCWGWVGCDPITIEMQCSPEYESLINNKEFPDGESIYDHLRASGATEEEAKAQEKAILQMFEKYPQCQGSCNKSYTYTNGVQGPIQTIQNVAK